MKPAILILNAGSSSVKFAVYAQTAALPVLLRGGIAALGHAPRLMARSPIAADHDRPLGHAPMSPGAAGLVNFDALARRGMTDAITAIGHRIVHGGLHFTQPTILTAAMISRLTELTRLPRCISLPIWKSLRWPATTCPKPFRLARSTRPFMPGDPNLTACTLCRAA